MKNLSLTLCLAVLLSGLLSGPAHATSIEAKYITQTANGLLKNEQSLGALTTGLLLNTVTSTTGVLSAYAGATCTNQVLRVLSASGAGTCVTLTSAYVDSTIAVASGTLTADQLIVGNGTNIVKTRTACSNGEVITWAAGAIACGTIDAAPSNATFITQTACSGCSAEQTLASLATGMVKNTTTTGVLSIAAAGTDYISPSGAETFATGTKTVTAKFDFGGGTLEIPNSTSLPGTCAVGDAYMDTDATSGQRFYLCESANTWALQGGGGGTDTFVIASGSAGPGSTLAASTTYDVGGYLGFNSDGTTAWRAISGTPVPVASTLTASTSTIWCNSGSGDGTHSVTVKVAKLSGTTLTTSTGNAQFISSTAARIDFVETGLSIAFAQGDLVLWQAVVAAAFTGPTSCWMNMAAKFTNP